MIRYILKIDSGESTFASSERTGKDLAAVRKAVHAAWSPGFPAWAEARDGSLLFALDRRGHRVGSEPKKKKRIVLASHRVKGKHRLRGLRGKAGAKAGERRAAGITDYQESATTRRVFVTHGGKKWELTSFQDGPVEVYRIDSDGPQYVGTAANVLHDTPYNAPLRKAWLLPHPTDAARHSWTLPKFNFEHNRPKK